MNETQPNKFIAFIKKYGLFIAPVLLFLFFMFLLVYSFLQTPSKKPSEATIPSPQAPSQTVVSSNPSNEPIPSGGPSDVGPKEKDDLGWAPLALSESDIGNDTSVNTTTLSDGSTQYTYDSDTPSRPIVTIVKNGINIFERSPVYNVSINSYTDFYGKPEYTAIGSQYWGQNAVAYIYLSKGFAFIANPQINQVYEQMYFQPVSKDQFKSIYENDLIGDLQPYQP